MEVKVCRICLNFSSTQHISRSNRSEQSFKRFCGEINCKDGGKVDEENMTICGECMPLVEAVLRSKSSVEGVEEEVLKLQKKLLRALNELVEELENHMKGVEKLEEIVKGSSPQPEVLERISSTEVYNAMEFRKGILEVSKDLRSFRTNVFGRVMTSVPSSPAVQEEVIKQEVTFSDSSSDSSADHDDEHNPSDDNISLPIMPEKRSLHQKDQYNGNIENVPTSNANPALPINTFDGTGSSTSSATSKSSNPRNLRKDQIKCEKCHQTYQRQTYYRHLKRPPCGTEIELAMCYQCGTTFKRKDYLKKHMKNKHDKLT